MIGGFTLTAPGGQVPELMREGVRRMDTLFTAALAAGRLERDPTLNIPEPPPIPVLEEEEEADDQQRRQRDQGDGEGQTWVYQVQIVAPNVQVYNFAMAHLRTIGGVQQVNPIAINPSGTSYVHVTFRGDLASLRSALAARGWNVQQSGYILRITSGGQPPPPPPAQQPPPQPAPQPTPKAPQQGSERPQPPEDEDE